MSVKLPKRFTCLDQAKLLLSDVNKVPFYEFTSQIPKSALTISNDTWKVKNCLRITNFIGVGFVLTKLMLIHIQSLLITIILMTYLYKHHTFIGNTAEGY